MTTRSPLRVRDAAPDDYPALTVLVNADHDAHFRATAEQLRAADARFAAHDVHFRRRVAVAQGELVGTCAFRGTWGGEVLPGRFWADVHARADRHELGAGAALLRQAIQASTAPVHEVLTLVREDRVPGATYLRTLGFTERFRSWGANLDPRSFEPARFDSVTEGLAAQGVRIVAYHELATDADRDAKLRSLALEAEQDVLAFDPIVPRHDGDIPGPRVDLDGTFVAVTDDGRYVGLTCLRANQPDANDRRRLDYGLTGVRRAYRGRGIAAALKVRAILAARAMGCTDLGTGGGGTDSPMMRVNRRLGFTIEPSWITFGHEP